MAISAPIGEVLELGPHDGGVHLGLVRRTRREAAVGAGDDPLLADDVGVADDVLGDQVFVLDVVVGVPDQARDQHLVVGELGLLPDLVLVLVARVGDLERVGAGVHLQHERGDLGHRHIGEARTVVEAVARVVADLVGRDAAQRVVERIDVLVAALLAVLPRVAGVGEVLDQPRVVDLEDEPGLDDRQVLLAHRLGDGLEVLGVAAVVLVLAEAARARRRHEDVDDGVAVRGDGGDGGLEVGDVDLEQVVTDVAHRAAGDDAAQRGNGCGVLAHVVGVVLRELVDLDLPRRRRAAAALLDLEPAEAVLHVADEADLAHLTVGDDVDAVLDLLAHAVGHGVADLLVEQRLVVRPAVLLLLHRVEQLCRAGEAARRAW